uniref:Uncharacterized protein n=1 Tax=Candidatus Kentrum sp. LPFa TaxID=2126335 RepID=A0A450W696_9GAMM|nr:MAG: hypothetical protein BECKLPF1236B_GA0070989_10383 [Candidatus Kentron sp. LPFa]
MGFPEQDIVLSVAAIVGMITAITIATVNVLTYLRNSKEKKSAEAADNAQGMHSDEKARKHPLIQISLSLKVAIAGVISAMIFIPFALYYEDNYSDELNPFEFSAESSNSSVPLPHESIGIEIQTPTHYDNTHRIVVNKATTSSIRLMPGEFILFKTRHSYETGSDPILCEECKNREPLKGGEYQYRAPMYAGAYEINLVVLSGQTNPIINKLRVLVEELDM